MNGAEPTRFDWDDFPEVIVHSSIYRLKNLPGYYAAKFGDHDAAARIVNSVTKLRHPRHHQFRNTIHKPSHRLTQLIRAPLVNQPEFPSERFDSWKLDPRKSLL